MYIVNDGSPQLSNPSSDTEPSVMHCSPSWNVHTASTVTVIVFLLLLLTQLSLLIGVYGVGHNSTVHVHA